MTGKASAVFHDIIFESGTLRAEQIDPFGSSIDFDKTTRKFQVLSASENREIQQRNSVYDEVRRLYKLRDEASQYRHPDAMQKIESLILDQLENLATKGSITQPVSMAVLAAAARESVLGTIQNLKREPVSLSGDQRKRLDTVEKTLRVPPQEDKLFKAINDLKTTFDGLIESFEDLKSVIESAIEDQKKNKEEEQGNKDETERPIDSLGRAIEEREIAASRVQKKEKNLTTAEVRKGSEKQDDLKTASEELDEKSEKLEAKLDTLNKFELAISKLTQSKARIEVDIEKLKRAAEILDRSSDAIRSPIQPDALMAKSAPTCGDGMPSRRGFEVLGPEGFRSFDQDERLVMAMSIDSKPLISTLQQFSEQRFNGQTDHSGEIGAAIGTERERLGSAQVTLDQLRRALEPDEKAKADEKMDKPSNASDILVTVLRAFNETKSSRNKALAEARDLVLKNTVEKMKP
jgi:hypothetical protein